MARGFIAGLALWAVLATAFATGAWAQEDRAWVQVEARPTLAEARDAAAGYAGQLSDVSGYYLSSGWYGIALGPYAPADAAALLDRLKADGLVPGDSYLADGAQFRQQFWPVGVGAQTAVQPAPDLPGLDAPEFDAPEPDAPEPDALAAVALDPALPSETFPETPGEALAGEELLTSAEREQVQVALRWAGAYEGAIDGDFGRGTRTAMAAWQAGNGFEPTGVLTRRERAALLGAYNAILADLGMEVVRDDAAGIEVRLPLGVVRPAGVEPPFARFEPTGEVPAQVLLISLPGDRDRLWGLYEIMQTLEVVPPEGPRERTDDGFGIEGIGAEVHTTAWATLEGGEIKGFALVWPAGDDARRERVLAEMRASFRRLPGVLDPGAATEEQGVDLVAGLRVRQPRATASGFFVDGEGTVVTAAAAVEGCEAITLDEAHPARVAAADAGLGIAVLRPEGRLAPRAVAAFQTLVPRLEAEVAVAGYPYGGVLAQPALTFGRLADLKGLDGEEELRRLALAPRPGDAGGPVLDAGGAVLGMLLPPAEGDRVLPEGVSFALDAEAIRGALARAGVTAATTAGSEALPPERLTRAAAGLTALVSCW